MKHLLIDFENVQPPNLDDLIDSRVTVWMFLGAMQKSLPVDLVASLLKLEKVALIRLHKTGKNALDFYLSYYLGKIIAQDAEAEIEILSRDGGYDVLLEHILAEKHARAVERTILPTNNLLPQAIPSSAFIPNTEMLDKVHKIIKEKNRPNTVATLINAVQSHTKCDQQIGQKIVSYLQKSGLITVQGSKVLYS